MRELLEQISGFDNVRRKMAKFQNWMKNSLKVHNGSILEQVWNIFSEASSSEPVGKGARSAAGRASEQAMCREQRRGPVFQSKQQHGRARRGQEE